MADKVGSKDLESKTTESKEIDSSYRLIVQKTTELADEYIPVIVAPFLNSLRYGNDLFKLIDKHAYYGTYSLYIEKLLQRPEMMIKMALLSDNTVLGWCLYEQNVLHYFWVKKEVRRQGIGNSLLPKTFDTFTHVTNKGLSIWVKKFAEARFNPFV